MIQFIVEKDGSITSPSIVRGLDARLDTAALDAIIVYARLDSSTGTRRLA